MCGISGIIGGSFVSARPLIERMVAAQHHRGPDAGVTTFPHGAALGHNRLAVIDLSEHANQPFTDHEQRLHLVYNGAIYNFQALRVELQQLGFEFRTSSDTEVVLHAFQQWGEQCVEHFNGMFAFAIWDAWQQRLFVARDRLGEKPLFYAYTHDGLVFASEPATMSLHPDIGRALSEQGLACYLALGYTTGEATLFDGVQRVPPACCGWYTPGQKLQLKRYWHLATHFENKRIDIPDSRRIEELTALIDDAVAIRMVADVPLGAFLSGGLDSSTIAAAMVRQEAQTHTHTFSIGFRSASFDERDYAREVARVLNTHHTERVHDDVDLAAHIASAAREPLADSSYLPMMLLSQTTREHVTVALSGDGADEAFLGYPTHAADELHHRHAQNLRRLRTPLTWLVNALPISFAKVSFDYRAHQWMGGLDMDDTDAHYHWREIFSPDERTGLVPGLAGINPALDTFRARALDVEGSHYLDRASYVDLTTWLPDDILVKVDRTTMAHSLEARAPFLDHRLIEYAASVPVECKYRNRRGKLILRESQRARLPALTLRRSKKGFNAPVSAWINTELRQYADELLNDPRLREVVDGATVDAMLSEHRRKRRDHGLKLLNLMTLGLWLNQ